MWHSDGMQFGRSHDLVSVDFALPTLTPRSRELLARAAGPRDEPWLRLGAPAFKHRDWLRSLYPPGSDPDSWLGIYASKLGALELNSTFYGLPSEATLERWIAQTPPEFRFCPKVPRAVSHELGGAELTVRVAAFAERMSRLGARLGPALFQLSERASPAAMPQLMAAASAFPEGFRLALELRHPAWFDAAALRDDLLAELERRGIAAVITDVSGRRDVCHASLSAAFAFVRFVGEGGHASDGPRVAAWMAQLKAWRKDGIRDAYFFVHQPDDIAAPQLLAVTSEHARALGIAVLPVPLEAERAPSSQLDLF